MQVFTSKWELRAKEITEKTVTVYAPRGIIFDRNRVKLVDNQNYYDLMFTPSEIGEIDTLEFCNLIGITMEDFYKKLDKVKKKEYHVPHPFITQIKAEDFARIREHLYKYKPGFFENVHTLRKYSLSIGAHILGYLNEVDSSDIKKDAYYKSGDYIGRTGLEKAYEKELRGEKGKWYLLKNAKGLQSGDIDQNRSYNAVNGQNLICTIDAELQKYGEQLMQNKIGSIVAIEPSTGEVLAMISAPSYNPNWMVGKYNRNKYFPELNKDTLSPTLNRSIYSEYPPGSIFKMFNALVGMKLGYLTPQTRFYCDGSLIGDHVLPGWYDMREAIKTSSNQWFLLGTKRFIQPGIHKSVFKDSRVGLEQWAKSMKAFGLGQKLPIELDDVKPGFIPDVAYYDKIYDGPRWAYSTIYSISIGQGEIMLNPLQMANLSCVLANRGHFYFPHLIKQIGNKPKRKIYSEKQIAIKDTSMFTVVIDAMRAVITEAHGTAWRARIDSISICGKTGTVENPHGDDHSVFMAFAPMKNPKIAIAVFVENGTWGGEWAAPIASLMVEKYLNGYIKDKAKEERILKQDFIHKDESE